MDEITPIIVVGVGRSGTTLVLSMLDAHPAIESIPENFFVIRHVAAHPVATRMEFKASLDACPKLPRTGITSKDLLDEFESDTINAADLYRRFLAISADRAGCRIVVDKAPKYIEWLSLFARMVPNAIIVHVLRDPRDVVLSRRKAEWSAGRHDLLHVLAYRAQVKIGRKDGRSLFGDRYVEVVYERLIADPREELTPILEKLGLSFDDQMLTFHRSAKRLVAEDEAGWKQNVTRPLMKDNVNKWMAAMTPREIEAIEAACWPVFAEGLYNRRKRDSGLTLREWGINVFVGFLSILYGSYVRWRVWRVRSKLS